MELQENVLIKGRYRLLEERGRGSFGEVWRARDEVTEAEVAVKIYIALDKQGLKEFTEEFKVANGLNHPNLLHADYYDICENRPFIVMPYCPKSSVSLVGKMDEGMAWKFLREVSAGLAYLHGKDIVHRDIKPDNIMQDKEGNFLISDFGISTRMRSTLRRNSTREMSQKDIAGTIGYMAPELFTKKPESVKATDIWAMGASLYELLSGELPFMGQGGVMQLHGAEIPELEDKYSKDLQGMLASCLAKDTWERPTAEQLSDYAVKRQKGEPAAFRWDRQEPQREEEARKTVVLNDVGSPSFDKDQHTPSKEIEVRGIEVGGVKFEMVYVEGGRFMMGAENSYDGEKPVHAVNLSSYWIGKYEVTRGLWIAVMGNDSSGNKSGYGYPVENVSWDDCQKFIKKLNAKTGLTFRLPREAEWEYAARGGRQSRGFLYSGSDNADEVAWHAGNSSLGFWKGRRTHPVGQKKPNELGLYDMSGNVWEWCQDWYGPYKDEAQTDPAGPASGRYRVLRGGSIWYVARYCRVSVRGVSAPGNRGDYCGLRLVLSL